MIQEEDIEDKKMEYTEEFKAELDRRYAAFKNGSESGFTKEESKKRIETLRSKRD